MMSMTATFTLHSGITFRAEIIDYRPDAYFLVMVDGREVTIMNSAVADMRR
jgi:hypothetical protein